MRPAPAQQPGGSCGQNAGEGPPAPVGYPGHGVTAPATGGGAARAVEAVWGRAALARRFGRGRRAQVMRILGARHYEEKGYTFLQPRERQDHYRALAPNRTS